MKKAAAKKPAAKPSAPKRPAKKPPATSPPPRLSLSSSAALDALAAGARNRLGAAARRREESGDVREIGELPEVADLERRAEGEASFRRFCEIYFPRTFRLAWSRDHLRVTDKLERAVMHGELFGIAMPRGSGKTSLCEVACIWAIFKGLHPFVVLIGATANAAKKNLRAIITILKTNELLAADFPEVCYPIACLQGIHQRKLTYRGELIGTEFTKMEVVLPTIPGSKASGAIIATAGITAGVRGMKLIRADGTTVRPSLVLLDDPQTKRSAKSLTMTDERMEIIKADVLGLAGPDVAIAGVACVTVVETGDVADQLLDHEKNAAWQGERCKMVYRWPDNEALWAQYAELREEGLRNGDGGKAATEFYRAHRAEMDKGSEVAWPERFRPGEISAIQCATNLRLEDSRAFAAEYQNEPLTDDMAAESLDAGEIAARVNQTKVGWAPEWATRVVMYIDVQKRLLYWIKIAFADDFTGAVIGYGTWPKQNRIRFTEADAPYTLEAVTKQPTLEGAIYAGLEQLCGEQIVETPRVGGGVVPFTRCGIDTGYQPDVVYRFCQQSAFKSVVRPCRGFGIGAKGNPLSEGGKKPGERIGLNCKLARVQKRALPSLQIDTNFWKSYTANRLRVGVGNRGALTLFGEKPADHRQLADHFTAESYTPTYGKGRWVDEWTNPPGGQNHWWDGAVSCHAMVSMEGAQLVEVGAGRAASKSPKPRLCLSEIQAAKRRGR